MGVLLRAVILSAAVGLLLAPARAQDQETTTGPLDLGLEEQVDVKLVLVDFLALDFRDNTVPDLTVDDLLLLVSGKKVEIASLDIDCPVGAAAEPRSGSKPAEQAGPTAQPRQMVLVFDYYHMANAADVFDYVWEMLDTWPQGDEMHMVASLGDVVRIESPFTDDIDEVRWAIQRMRSDPDLYAGNYGRITERRFFKRVNVLFDLLGELPGRKTIILFSGPFLPDGFFYDPLYKELSGLSTATRTTIYPVDTGGLRTIGDGQRLGGPPKLRRLATETGGRMTADTNDLGMAYARAHRDLGCTYTLGFYDHRPKLDRERRVSIRTDRKGVRIIYPEFYVIRSEEEKRESMLRTASMAPHMFEAEEVSTELFVLGPHSGNRWRTVIAMEIRPGDHVTPYDQDWTVKGLVRKPNGTVIRSFKRRFPVARPGPGVAPSVVTLFQEVIVPPGRYIISAIVSGPDGENPWARTQPIELVKIPKGGPFLIGPILGRRGEQSPFEPLLVAEAQEGETLESLTLVCVAGSETPIDMQTIAREVLALDTEDIVELGATSAVLPGKGKVHCHEVIDELSTDGLGPGRYEITAFTETADHVTGTASAEFTIRPGGVE